MSESEPVTEQNSFSAPPIPVVSKPRKIKTAPGIKSTVIQKRINGASKRSIASELGIGRNRVTKILRESNVEQALECGIQASVGLIPQAIHVAEVRLAANSENMAIKVLENTIWPISAKQGKASDPGLVLAIQNLMLGPTQINSTLHKDAATASTNAEQQSPQGVEHKQDKQQS